MQKMIITCDKCGKETNEYYSVTRMSYSDSTQPVPIDMYMSYEMCPTCMTFTITDEMRKTKNEQYKTIMHRHMIDPDE